MKLEFLWKLNPGDINAPHAISRGLIAAAWRKVQRLNNIAKASVKGIATNTQVFECLLFSAVNFLVGMPIHRFSRFVGHAVAVMSLAHEFSPL